MFDPGLITQLVVSTACMWLAGYGGGKAVAWVRSLSYAA